MATVADTPQDIPNPAPSFWERHKKKLITFVAALFLVPYYAFKQMDARKALELNAQEIALDERVPGVKLRTTSKDWMGVVVYQDKHERPRSGLGILVVTLDDHKKAPDQFKAFNLADSDFPILAFFDSTGHDASGTAIEITRASDGVSLYKAENLVPFAPLVLPLPDGHYRIYKLDGTYTLVSQETWARDYMGMQPQFTPEQLQKMSDEDLKKYGYTKMTRDEFDKKYGNADNKGIRGQVLRVGGRPNPVEPVYCPVHIYKGAIKPLEKFDKTDARIAQSVHTDKDGSYSVNLPPGTYTVVVELEGGKLRGNAFDPTVWPSVSVGIAWVDYEVRIPVGVK